MHLVGSNCILELCEAQAIQYHVINIYRRITSLDQNIEFIRQQLEALVGRRHILQCQFDQHTRLLSQYAQRVPVEILTHIFVYCQDDTAEFQRPSSRYGPLLLGQICRRWRSIVLSTPCLWQSLFVKCGKNARCHDLSWVETWLSRSGLLPLMLSFHSPIDRGEIIDILMRFSSRWRRIRLNMPFTSYRRLSSLKGCLPALEEIEMCTMGEWAHFTCDFLLTAPLLRCLVTDGSEYPIMMPVPWAQLMHFSGSLDSDSFLTMLESASCLASCKVWLRETSQPTLVQQQYCSHSSLMDLSIVVERPAWRLGVTLSKLTFPYLRSFSIRCRHHNWACEELAPLLHRSSTLEELTLDEMILTEDQLIVCLEQTPSLRKLKVRPFLMKSILTPTLLKRLSFVDTQPRLAPKLEQIVGTMSPDTTTGSALKDMIKSRSWVLSDVTNCGNLYTVQLRIPKLI